MKNKDASCQNCEFLTSKGQCKHATNMVIDYYKNDNPHCWHWQRKRKGVMSIIKDWIK